MDYNPQSVTSNSVAQASLSVKDQNIIPGKDKLKGELKLKIHGDWYIQRVLFRLQKREYVFFKRTIHVPLPKFNPRDPKEPIRYRTEIRHYRT